MRKLFIFVIVLIWALSAASFGSEDGVSISPSQLILTGSGKNYSNNYVNNGIAGGVAIGFSTSLNYVSVANGEVSVSPARETRLARALWGTYAAHVMGTPLSSLI